MGNATSHGCSQRCPGGSSWSSSKKTYGPGGGASNSSLRRQSTLSDVPFRGIFQAENAFGVGEVMIYTGKLITQQKGMFGRVLKSNVAPRPGQAVLKKYSTDRSDSFDPTIFSRQVSSLQRLARFEDSSACHKYEHERFVRLAHFFPADNGDPHNAVILDSVDIHLRTLFDQISVHSLGRDRADPSGLWLPVDTRLKLIAELLVCMSFLESAGFAHLFLSLDSAVVCYRGDSRRMRASNLNFRLKLTNVEYGTFYGDVDDAEHGASSGSSFSSESINTNTNITGGGRDRIGADGAAVGAESSMRAGGGGGGKDGDTSADASQQDNSGNCSSGEAEVARGDGDGGGGGAHGGTSYPRRWNGTVDVNFMYCSPQVGLIGVEPELARKHVVTAKDDAFSLGVMIAELGNPDLTNPIMSHHKGGRVRERYARIIRESTSLRQAAGAGAQPSASPQPSSHLDSAPASARDGSVNHGTSQLAEEVTGQNGESKAEWRRPHSDDKHEEVRQTSTRAEIVLDDSLADHLIIADIVEEEDDLTCHALGEHATGATELVYALLQPNRHDRLSASEARQLPFSQEVLRKFGYNYT